MFNDGCRHTLHRRQAKLLGNLSVLNTAGLLERHATDELGQVAAASNGGATAKGLELDVRDGVVVGVNLDLQLHDIAAGRGADETGADVAVALAHAADIARVVVVVQDLLVVGSLADGLLD